MSDVFPENLDRLAKILAGRDMKEGGHRHGAWGASLIIWAGRLRQEHAECGKLDRGPLRSWINGHRPAPAVICPVHGFLEGPRQPS